MTNGVPEARCLSCGASWSAGQWTDGCEECGGGALEIPCLLCGGRCGSTWRKAVMDSNDFGMNHWCGQCLLPKDEQKRLRLEAQRNRQESGQNDDELFRRMMRTLDERLARFRGLPRGRKGRD